MAVTTERLRGLSLEELDKEETEIRGEIWKLKMQLATGQLDNPRKVREARRDLARVLTIRQERRIADAGGAEG